MLVLDEPRRILLGRGTPLAPSLTGGNPVPNEPWTTYGRGMARLGGADRARLPDSAFAYVDARGRRRLPIHDAGHVRNALARFDQVAFEDEAARDRARTRLLNAAKKFKIVPVGFITSQLQSARELGRRAGEPIGLPSGFVTMLLTDVEGSTALVHRLGDDYGDLLERLRALLRETTLRSGGHVVETRADEFFAVFDQPAAALTTALTVQRELRTRASAGEEEVRVRIGIHSGYPTRAKENYIGMAVHTAARICDAAHGGQIVVSGDFRTAIGVPLPDGVRVRRLGTYQLRGLPDEIELLQVVADELPRRFPPLRISR
jgi:class 3 adenylate cyclase